MGIAHFVKNENQNIKSVQPIKPEADRLSILIVEDSDPERELLSEILSKSHYRLYEASNAFSALEILNKVHVDIVLSDLMMPVMDGIDLCKEVKSHYKNIYFIMLTAKDNTEDKISGLNSGADDYITKPYDINELLARVNVAARIVKSNKRLIFLNEELEKVIETDELTGLKNRRFFNKELNKEINRSTRYKHTLAVIIVDVDNFKEINDNYGHIVGDLVLKHVSGVMQNSIRETDFLCRYGGDEFVILLPETTPKNAFVVAEKIRRNIVKHPFKHKRTTINPTISLGVSVKTPAMKKDASEILESADKALYISKNRGKNKAIINKSYRINELV